MSPNYFRIINATPKRKLAIKTTVGYTFFCIKLNGIHKETIIQKKVFSRRYGSVSQSITFFEKYTVFSISVFLAVLDYVVMSRHLVPKLAKYSIIP